MEYARIRVQTRNNISTSCVQVLREQKQVTFKLPKKVDIYDKNLYLFFLYLASTLDKSAERFRERENTDTYFTSFDFLC